MPDFSKKLKTSSGLLVLLLVVGTAGYMMCGRDWMHAAYQTVVVLTTVGMEGPESDAERAWSMFLMVVGVGIVLYATGQVVAFFVDGQIRSVLGRRQLMNEISHLKDHFIIVGSGRMGRALCQMLHYKNVPFVLVEDDSQRCEEADRQGYLSITGDAMNEQILLKAGIDRARGLATCLPRDADNVFVTLTARGLNERITIVARSESIRSEPKLIRAGASRVICPPVIGAGRVSNLLLNPAVEELLELDGPWPDLEMFKLSLYQFPDVGGKTLQELSLTQHTGVIIVAVVRSDGHRQFNPSPDTRIGPEDDVILVGPNGCNASIIESLRHSRAA